jgi:hypothetical protein
MIINVVSFATFRRWVLCLGFRNSKDAFLVGVRIVYDHYDTNQDNYDDCDGFGA